MPLNDLFLLPPLKTCPSSATSINQKESTQKRTNPKAKKLTPPKPRIDERYTDPATMSSRLAPLSEEPIDDCSKKTQSWRSWLKTHFSFSKKSDLKILLSVLGCPLFPVSIDSQIPQNQVSSSAQYIIQHFVAATGCRKLEGRVKNVFATGKVTMGMADDMGSGGGGGANGGGGGGVSEKGCFVMWQMNPNKWLIELVVAGQKVVAGSDGAVAWRRTPWLGVHAAKGAVRPLRRAIQGLDPVAVAAVFSPSQYMGEKHIAGVDCFVLKLSTDQTDLVDRSDNTAEMIKHVIFGYFSQKSGLLVCLEDSYLTRIQSPGANPLYWETTMATRIEDYRSVEGGVLIAHAGQSSVVITRFGDNLKAGAAITRLEEKWTIDDLAFNVEGLSLDCFIPPKEVQKDEEAPESRLDWRSSPLQHGR